MNGKKLARGTILTALCAAVLLYVNSTVSMAYWVVVKSNETRVRDAASTDSEVMTAVNAGDRLNVVSEEQGGDGNKWYKVSINNVSGYVRADTVDIAPDDGTDAASEQMVAAVALAEQPAAEPTVTADVQPVEASSTSTVEPMATQAATVKTDNVNVRANASTNGSQVAKLQKGAAVTLTGTTTDSSGDIWYQVNFINNGSNVTGFIRSDFVEPGEVVDTTSPEEAPTETGGELADMYDDMPAEETTNNDYELFFEPDTEGVNCWYIHDNIAQKRYKLEQLMQVDEMNTHNVELKNGEIERLRIVLIVLAVLLVLALAAAAIFGFKYHDLKEGDDGDEDDDDDDDDDDDFRPAPPVRRRERAEAETVRRREAVRDEERSARGTARRSDGAAPRRAAGTVQRRPEREETVSRSSQAGRARTEAEGQRRQPSGTVRTRSVQQAPPARRTPAAPERETARRSGRSDVEWKSKNFLAGDEDELDFSFINGEDEE